MDKIKVAITGGPSGGKTTLIETLKKEFGLQITVVPEAASILYGGGFPRKKSILGRIATQRAIYFTQRELETIAIGESTNALLVFDRGSLDSIAYWPNDEDDFFKNIQSNKKVELERYDWVIHLDTASNENYDLSNPIRTETHTEALLLNEKIKMAWNGHQRRITIASDGDFLAKITKSIHVIKSIVKGKSFEDVCKIVS
ncbi:MAG: ATP-binding protein [Bdellovibrionaceae bacterium]|nr:ATP-binding protein [Pseudobdellovibrionaceae bacterium]